MQVMVVDMNVGFTQKGNLYSPRIEALVQPMTDFLSHLSRDDDDFMEGDDTVIFTTDCHSPNDSELKRFPEHCMINSYEPFVRQELIDACRPNVKFDIIYKNQHDLFVGNLSRRNIITKNKNWIVIGCVTDICIEAAVAGLVMREQNITVVRNLIDTFDIPGHDADEINKFWFEQRFPNVWGAKVVEDWKELV